MLLLFLDLHLLQHLVARMPQHDIDSSTAAVHQACTTGVVAYTGQSQGQGLHLCAQFCACVEDHKFELCQVSTSCCVSYRPANFTVTSGSGPAANIIAADMEASRVSLASLPVVLDARSLSLTQLF